MYHVIWKDTVIEAITWLKQHNPHYGDIIPNDDSPHYGDIIPNDDWYSSILNSELATLVHEDAVHQERSQSTVVNINTQTHDPDLDDEEQIHEQQSTDDILITYMKILPTAFVKCWHWLCSKYGIPLLCTIHFLY